ncbi:Ref family protein [Flagellatimonas centrodinii]|uniref:Ref family recombination enhancement nuclease n=1 Tax=Flagellatimonas centrodinii TaxID=2806210 RepID=UPI001FEEE580|nr:Ref family recombination enhancement nuclease [Flagellatimonas centrodinii]ULQ47412.1 Ref family protein [Flagellatimonas centrodinii]
MLGTSTGAMTRADVERIRALKDIGCVACLMLGVTGRWPDAHHLTEGGRRLGHQQTAALCPWHHVGRPDGGWTVTEMRALYGASFGLEPAAFREQFGTDAELLARQDALIARHGRLTGVRPCQ